VDLDLAQVRAFVAAAEDLHFGRAAGRLFLTQQALSRRIARLEHELGVQLFTRDARAVQLTAAGRRFLTPARQILADADRAVQAARDPGRPLRIDVWGHLYAPMRTVGPVIAGPPPISAEIGHSRDLAGAVASLGRGEIDAGFGRVHPPAAPGQERVTSRLARLEPVDAVLSTGHPLAGRPGLRPSDLRHSILWSPAALGKLDFLRHFADRFGIPAEDGTANLGLDHLIGAIRADSRRFTLLPADIPLPRDTGIRCVPLTDPTPLYAWSLIWPSQDQHPLLGTLLERFAETGRQRRWLEYDPARDWLPDHDRAGLHQLDRRSAGQGQADAAGVQVGEDGLDGLLGALPGGVEPQADPFGLLP
jgi:DNA-binding transcriptional LysR family regulator